MSIPWGETKSDDDLGGYHLVWTRDLVQSASALLATGQTGTPLRALIWLAAIQRPDGSFPQNSWIDGTAYWSGLQLVSLVRSRHDGVCFARVDPAFQRYVVNPVQSHHEIWSLRHPLRRVSRGKILRIILAAEATIIWSTDDWARRNESHTTHRDELNLWFADFPTAEWPSGSVLAFTFFWERDQRWENRNWQVSVL